MKTLLVLYDEPDWKYDIPYNSAIYDSTLQRKGYEHFADTAKKKGFLFARASAKWYKGKGIFSKAWVFDKKWKKVKDLKADVVWDKTPYTKDYIKVKNKIKKELKILNDPKIDILCSDKSITYKFYKKFMPRCFTISNKRQLKSKLKKIRTEKFVLKPVCGSSAKGLVLASKDKLPKSIPKNMILQEFIDTSHGIPNFTKTVSDMRLVMCDGKINNAFVRKSSSGWISNVSRGGKIIFIPNVKIPKKLREMAKKIDSKLKNYKHRLYTIDFVFDENKKPWLMEMNSKPGFFIYRSYKKHKIAEKFESAVVDSLKNLL